MFAMLFTALNSGIDKYIKEQIYQLNCSMLFISHIKKILGVSTTEFILWIYDTLELAATDLMSFAYFIFKNI